MAWNFGFGRPNAEKPAETRATTKDDYYVYAWRRPDTGEIFYIGKGRLRRDSCLKRHNAIFMEIVSKLK